LKLIEQNRNESRGKWLLWLLKQKTETGEDKKQLWRAGNHPEEIRTGKSRMGAKRRGL